MTRGGWDGSISFDCGSGDALGGSGSRTVASRTSCPISVAHQLSAFDRSGSEALKPPEVEVEVEEKQYRAAALERAMKVQ